MEQKRSDEHATYTIILLFLIAPMHKCFVSFPGPMRPLLMNYWWRIKETGEKVCFYNFIPLLEGTLSSHPR